MKLTQRACWSLLLAGIMIWGPATLTQAQDSTQAQAAAAIPNITIPGVPPTGNCCLWQIHKKASGERIAQYGTPYNFCNSGQTVRGDMQIKLTLASEGVPCDQPGINPIPNGSLLEARGKIIKRTDGFAHFLGDFIIKNAAGNVLFRGTLEAIDRIGTHHPGAFGTEACNRQNHFEGWLVGRGVPPGFQNSTLRALIVAQAKLPTGAVAASVSASIDGVLIQCPPM